MITKKKITTRIYELGTIAHFKVSYEEHQKEPLISLCKSAIEDMKTAALPAKINVAKSGLCISFEVPNTKIKKAMSQLINEAVKDLK